MKKITSVLVLTLFILSAKAEGDDRKVRFGLAGSGSLSWIKPDNKYMKRKGLKAGYSYGLLLDLNMGKNYAFATGIQVNKNGGNITYVNDTASVLVLDALGNEYRTYYRASTLYKYSITDIELPISLKLKTNEIGYLTYFGQIGVITNFRYKAKANWSYTDDIEDVATSQSDIMGRKGSIDANDYISFFRSALLIGAGAEYNLTGNTSIVFGLAFKNGFSPFNTFSKKIDDPISGVNKGIANATLDQSTSSGFTYNTDGNGNFVPTFSGPVKKGFTNQIVLNVGIFF